MATHIKMSPLEQRILNKIYLSPNGFERVEDLLKIRGIGEKSFQKIRPHVVVTDPR